MAGQPRCPHCNATLQPFTLPDAGGWDSDFHLACFNDECSYYRRGWEWMRERYGVSSSYRYRVDPATGVASPIAVWSPDALKSRIVDAEITEEQFSDEDAPEATAGESDPS
jgi:hypothetical protein